MLLTVLSVHVPTEQAELEFPPSWEVTTFVRVGTLGEHGNLYCMRVTHSGMVRAVDPLPAVS